MVIVLVMLLCCAAALVIITASTINLPERSKPKALDSGAELKSLLGFYKMGYEDGKKGISERDWYDIGTGQSNLPMPTTFEKGVKAYRLGFIEGRDGMKNRAEILELSAETEQKFLKEIENFKSSSSGSQLNSSQF